MDHRPEPHEEQPQPPPSYFPLGQALDARSKAVVAVAVVALPAAVFLGSRFKWWCAFAAVASSGAAALSRRRLGALTALLSALSIVGLSVPAIADLSPAPFLIALAITWAAAAATGPGAPPWLRRGEWSAAVSLRVVATVIASGVALVLWFVAFRPDVSDVKGRLPLSGGWTLLVAIVAWSAANAVAEEFVFRGALMHALEAAFGARAGLILQAATFGLVHFRGFPHGWSGVLLATVYGLMLGETRRRSDGMLAPWTAHVFADLTIVVIVIVATP